MIHIIMIHNNTILIESYSFFEKILFTLLLRGMLNLNSVEQTAVVVDVENLKKLAVHSRNHSK